MMLLLMLGFAGGAVGLARVACAEIDEVGSARP